MIIKNNLEALIPHDKQCVRPSGVQTLDQLSRGLFDTLTAVNIVHVCTPTKMK